MTDSGNWNPIAVIAFIAFGTLQGAFFMWLLHYLGVWG